MGQIGHIINKNRGNSTALPRKRIRSHVTRTRNKLSVKLHETFLGCLCRFQTAALDIFRQALISMPRQPALECAEPVHVQKQLQYVSASFWFLELHRNVSWCFQLLRSGRCVPSLRMNSQWDNSCEGLSWCKHYSNCRPSSPVSQHRAFSCNLGSRANSGVSCCFVNVRTNG